VGGGEGDEDGGGDGGGLGGVEAKCGFPPLGNTGNLAVSKLGLSLDEGQVNSREQSRGGGRGAALGCEQRRLRSPPHTRAPRPTLLHRRAPCLTCCVDTGLTVDMAPPVRPRADILLQCLQVQEHVVLRRSDMAHDLVRMRQ
jgi:hypothetical protein